MKKCLDKIDQNITANEENPFEKYQNEHLMYCPARILRDEEFNQHVKQMIENVCLSQFDIVNKLNMPEKSFFCILFMQFDDISETDSEENDVFDIAIDPEKFPNIPTSSDDDSNSADIDDKMKQEKGRSANQSELKELEPFECSGQKMQNLVDLMVGKLRLKVFLDFILFFFPVGFDVRKKN